MTMKALAAEGTNLPWLTHTTGTRGAMRWVGGVEGSSSRALHTSSANAVPGEGERGQWLRSAHPPRIDRRSSDCVARREARGMWAVRERTQMRVLDRDRPELLERIRRGEV